MFPERILLKKPSGYVTIIPLKKALRKKNMNYLIFVILIPGVILEVISVAGLMNVLKWYGACTALVKADIVGEVRWEDSKPVIYSEHPEMYVPNKKRTPLLEYRVGSGERIQSYDKRIKVSSSHPYLIGNSVMIMYNPKKPEEFVDPSLKSGSMAKLGGLALLVLGVMLFFIIMLMA